MSLEALRASTHNLNFDPKKKLPAEAELAGAASDLSKAEAETSRTAEALAASQAEAEALTGQKQALEVQLGAPKASARKGGDLELAILGVGGHLARQRPLAVRADELLRALYVRLLVARGKAVVAVRVAIHHLTS